MTSKRPRSRIQSMAVCLTLVATSALSGTALSETPGVSPSYGYPVYGFPGFPGHSYAPYGYHMPPPGYYAPAMPTPPLRPGRMSPAPTDEWAPPARPPQPEMPTMPAPSDAATAPSMPEAAAGPSMQGGPTAQGRVFCRVIGGVRRCWRF